MSWSGIVCWYSYGRNLFTSQQGIYLNALLTLGKKETRPVETENCISQQHLGSFHFQHYLAVDMGVFSKIDKHQQIFQGKI